METVILIGAKFPQVIEAKSVHLTNNPYLHKICPTVGREKLSINHYSLAL